MDPTTENKCRLGACTVLEEVSSCCNSSAAKEAGAVGPELTEVKAKEAGVEAEAAEAAPEYINVKVD